MSLILSVTNLICRRFVFHEFRDFQSRETVEHLAMINKFLESFWDILHSKLMSNFDSIDVLFLINAFNNADYARIPVIVSSLTHFGQQHIKLQEEKSTKSLRCSQCYCAHMYHEVLLIMCDVHKLSCVIREDSQANRFNEWFPYPEQEFECTCTSQILIEICDGLTVENVIEDCRGDVRLFETCVQSK